MSTMNNIATEGQFVPSASFAFFAKLRDVRDAVERYLDARGIDPDKCILDRGLLRAAFDVEDGSSLFAVMQAIGFPVRTLNRVSGSRSRSRGNRFSFAVVPVVTATDFLRRCEEVLAWVRPEDSAAAYMAEKARERQALLQRLVRALAGAKPCSHTVGGHGGHRRSACE